MVCFGLLFSSLLHGQESGNVIPFHPLPVNPGHVNALLKSKDDFMWIATQDGLFRYDGYELKAFRPNAQDSTSIPGAFIWTLNEAADRTLWLGTFGQGLASYDPRRGDFHVYPLPAGPTGRQSVRSLLSVAGSIYVGTEDGLWILNEQRNFRPLHPFTTDSTDQLTIHTIHPLPDGELLIGSSQGLSIYDPEGNQWFATALQNTGIYTIIADEEGLWIGTLAGLYRATYQNRQIEIGQYYPIAEGEPLAQAVTTLYLDEQQTLWIGTLKGFYRYQLAQDAAQPVRINSSVDHPLPDLQINSIYAVEPGLMWMGTRQGISTFSNAPPVFYRIDEQTLEGKLCSPVILGSVEDEDDNWWLGTQKGLTKITVAYANDKVRLPDITKIQCYSPDQIPGMPEAYIINNRISHEEHWVTFWRGGVRKLVSQGRGFTLEAIPGLAELTQNAGIHDILTDHQGHTWVATPNRGIVEWDREAAALYPHEPQSVIDGGLASPYIFYLLEDRQQGLWAGTANGGLCYKGPRDSTFQCFLNQEGEISSLSNDVVLSVFQDRQDRIWACTAAGLNLWLGDGRFQRFDQQNGLPSELIYGMLQDDDDLWLSTNGGLVRMSETAAGWQFQAFTQEDGLQGDEFNQYAFFKTRRGLLCFGGPNGLSYFDPQAVQAYPYAPKVALTDFQLFNKSQTVGGRLDTIINETHQLRLTHQENFLAFEFAALGYTQSAGNIFAYQLQGLDQDWVYANDRRYISYSNLAPGEYRLRIKAANHDGVWNDEIKSLVIIISPPWWQRWWAILLFAVLGISALFAIVQLRIRTVRRLERVRQQEREAFRKKTAQDFHDEAGNRITKMALLTEVLRQQPDENNPRLWQQLEQNIQGLRVGMRDFIWVLDPLHDNLYATLLRLKGFGQTLFEHTSTQFVFSEMDEKWHSISLNSATRRHLLLVFKEAMHNSLKHAKAQRVTFEIKYTATELHLLLLDDGVGFSSTVTLNGHGLHNMRDRAQKINGQLTIDSSPAKGATIALILQIPQMGH